VLVLILVLTVLATATLVTAVAVLAGREQPALERRLAGYDKAAPGNTAEPSGPETAVIQQAVDFTENIARRAGILQRVERALEQSDLPIRASELVFYVPVFGILLFLLLAILVGPWIALIAAFVVGLIPVAYVSSKKTRRTRDFEHQLPDMLTLLASSLRAGFALMQGLESVAQEVAEPMRGELQRVFTEVRLGGSLDDALVEAAERMNSRDLAWTAQAIRIQREVGGNLASLLETVADTMQKRERIRREIRTLTAEGRLSAVILSLMPFVIGIMIYILQPDYIKGLFDHTWGVIAVIGAGVSTVIGWFWLRKIVDIEV
jgi:tight adherence protein B